MRAGDLGDQIGMESCLDLETDAAMEPPSRGGRGENRWGVSKKRLVTSGKKVKVFPPPLPLQTSTVMKRYYTDDGRLIITEEKVKSPEYFFRAHRSDGRLTLQLVLFEDDIDQSSRTEVVAPAEEGSSNKKPDVGGSGGGGGGGSRGVGQCYSYRTAAATASCLFVNQNPVLSIRPVQI